MGSSFRGLSIGISGLYAQQRALDVTGHNISNVNTPGYSRQSVFHTSSAPESYGRNRAGVNMQLGTGVDIQQIKQYKDEFLDQKLRRESKDLGYWETKQAAIEELEAIFNDNSEEGLQAVMDNFWNSWAQLAKPTGGLVARALVKEAAIAFVETVNNIDLTLTNFRINKDNEIRENVSRINSIVKRIAELNHNIDKIEAGGIMANDFRDKRSSLMNELSKMANVRINEGSILTIALEGRLIVEGANYEQIEVVGNPQNNGFAMLRWAQDKQGMEISGGTIKALFETRDGLVDGFRQRIDELVKGVSTEINAIHSLGYGIRDSVRRNLFINVQDGTGNNINLSNIGFNPELNEIDNIAAGSSMPPYNNEDNRLALEISELRRKSVFDSKTYVGSAATGRKYDFDEFYRNLISDLGNSGQEAKIAADAKRMLIEQVEYKRQAISGVSLDEEMTNLIRFEHSYNAAARIVNAMDEMLDVIVNRIGLGGR